MDKPTVAKKVFAEHGWETSEEDVVTVTRADNPGRLGSVVKRLGDAGINIQYAYTGPAKGPKKARTYLAVADLEAALKAVG